MLLVRFTWFPCGGTALGISVSHKIVDSATLIAVLGTLAATCRGAAAPAIPDLGLAASLFPPREIPGISANIRNSTTGEKFTTRRFVFPASKVGELKSRVVTALRNRKAADVDIPFQNRLQNQFQPSRVEVVLALIWRCAVKSTRFKTGSFKPSALLQGVNLRPRMDPPVPATAIGNLVWPFTAKIEKEEEGESKLEELVRKMREGMNEFMEKKAKRFSSEGVMEFLKERREKEKERVVYKCTSWCKSGLLEMDYGWGNAVWMTSVNKVVNNTFALMDGRDGGVEALVTLDETEMEVFQKDQELLQYAILNPSIVVFPPHKINAAL